MILAVPLFISLSFLFLLLIVPGEDAAPAAVTMDSLRREIEGRLVPEDNKSRLEILGRKAQDVVKTGILAGVGLGLLMTLLTLGRMHWAAILVGIVSFVAGLMLVRFGISSEFTGWQAKVFDEVPNLINFAPAFLKTGGITLQRAIKLTLPFLSGPLADEIWMAHNMIERTGRARDAFNSLSERVGHPCMVAICQRLSTSWDATPSPDLFDDLTEQIQDVEEIAAASATAGKAGLAAGICVLGLLGVGLVYGYPAWQYMASKIMLGMGG